MNTYLKYQPPIVQFVAFLGLAAAFLVLNTLLINYAFGDVTAALMHKDAPIAADLVVKFKWAQLISAVLSFIVPALLIGYFSSPAPLPYLGLRKHLSVLLAGATVLLLIMVQPFVGFLGILNSKMDFGSFQKVFKEAEATYTRATQVFLQMDSPVDLIINIFIMALLPAIAEELFFRGALQRVLLRMTKIPVIAILISSLVFAFLHGTIFKVLPIFVLGVLLGTLYHVTRNLWYNIVLHFLNNALAVIAVYFSTRSEFMRKLANDNISITWYAALLSLIVTLGIVYFITKKSAQVLPVEVTDEDNDYIA
jgi:membrane protease YdiL (CAAX protease family)